MKQRRFPKPIRIASYKNLLSTFNGSRDATGRGSSAGIDNITPHEFRSHLDRNIRTISSLLIEGSYRFKNLRPVPIPKDNKKVRLICIPTVSDRLVQRLALNYLIKGDKLGIRNKTSFGFIRQGGGVREAIRKARNLRNNFPWALKSDIESFFDRIERAPLKQNLERKLRASSVVPILFEAIDSEILASETRIEKLLLDIKISEGTGLRQGMPLSPILSNFVLRDFDLLMEKRHAHIVRYADDFIIFANSEGECHEVLPFVQDELAKKGHSIPKPGLESKTVIYAPHEEVQFLGLDISPRNNRKGYEIRVPKAAFSEIRRSLGQYSDFDYVEKAFKKLSATISRINSVSSGFSNVYAMASNYSDLQSHIGNCRSNAVKGLLAQIFDRDVLEILDDKRKHFLELSEILEDRPI